MNTVDGLHPDEDGARIIYEVVLDAFKKHGNKKH
jgi:lysophospholipase L1-like esterase